MMFRSSGDDGGASYGASTGDTTMTTTSTKNEVAKVANNTPKHGAAIDAVLDAKAVVKAGPLALIQKHADRFNRLIDDLNSAKSDDSVRGINLAFWRDTPEGQKSGERYASLKALGRGISPTQKKEKETLKALENEVNMLLIATCETQSAIGALQDAGFDVAIRGVSGTKHLNAWIKGPKDDDAAPFGVTALRKLVTVDVSAFGSYADLQSASVGARKGKAGKQAGAENGVERAKLADVAEGVESAIAGLAFTKDGGLSVKARQKLAMLWAHLDSVIPDDVKQEARKAFDAEGDDSNEAQQLLATVAGAA
jgi:hypothetical protein